MKADVIALCAAMAAGGCLAAETVEIPGVCEVSLSCPTAGPWKVGMAESADSSRPAGVFDIVVSLESEREAPPPRFEVSFSVPQRGIHFAWNSGAEDLRLPPKWHGGFVSSLAKNMPLVELMGNDDMNRLAFAASEAVLPVRCRAGLREQDCTVPCSLTFFEQPAAPAKSYRVCLRFDSRRRRWDDTVRELSAWMESAGGYEPMRVPESARDPLYSTWYAFTQDVSAGKIEDEARRAASLGMKTLILDDGWQTDESGRAYERCGDMEVSRRKFPDGMAAHVARVRAAGMKYVVWCTVAFVGYKNAQFGRFRGKYLRDQPTVHCSVLDPRFPEVREHLASLYERMLREWGVDGFKFDYVGQFALQEGEVDPAVAECYAGRDMKSVPDAVDALMTDVMKRLLAIRPDLLVEYRQPYLGPAIRRYGNMIRAIDCPGEMQKNIIRTAMLRLTSGDTAVHSDMLEWNVGADPEDAAQPILASLFSTVQYSMVLSRLPARHVEMLRHWIGFTQRHRAALLRGRFTAEHPEAGYTLLSSESDDERVVAVYVGGVVAKVGGGKGTVVVNATGADGLVLELDQPRRAVVRDTFGKSVGEVGLAAGLSRLPVPKSGYAEL